MNGLRWSMAVALLAAVGIGACDPGTLDTLESASAAGSSSGGAAGSAAGGSVGGSDAGAAGGSGGVTGGTGGTAGSDASSGGATAIGKPCDANTACPAGLFCLQALTAVQQRVCTRGCCTSADCGAGGVCWPSTLGGPVCRLASNVGRSTPGTAAAGEPCKQNTDCRSGLCGSDGRCVDTCCTDADCPDTAAPDCMYASTPNGVGSFECAQGGSAGPMQPCNANSDCKSGMCLTNATFAMCTAPCCGSKDCQNIAVLPGSCAYYSAGGVTARVCVPGQLGGMAVGSPCAKNADCKSNLCLTVNGLSLCSDACCRDSDCGDPKLACRPVPIGGNVLRLACVPL